jgi:hypothetical protein
MQNRNCSRRIGGNSPGGKPLPFSTGFPGWTAVLLVYPKKISRIFRSGLFFIKFSLPMD